MSLPPLVLASASPRRADLLRQAGLTFHVLPSSVPETDSEHLSPRELCLVNAHRKARAVAKRHPDCLVLGADTLVFLDDAPLGKPLDLPSAAAMLCRLQGRAHQVVTGVCLLHARAHHERLFTDTTEVRFKPLSEDAIRAYLAAVNPLDKAGAYAIQEHGDLIVDGLEGSFSNVVGLPVEAVLRELEAWPPR